MSDKHIHPPHPRPKHLHAVKSNVNVVSRNAYRVDKGTRVTHARIVPSLPRKSLSMGVDTATDPTPLLINRKWV